MEYVLHKNENKILLEVFLTKLLLIPIISVKYFFLLNNKPLDIRMG